MRNPLLISDAGLACAIEQSVMSAKAAAVDLFIGCRFKELGCAIVCRHCDD